MRGKQHYYIRHLLFKITKNSVNVLSQTEGSFLAILPWNSRTATRKKYERETLLGLQGSALVLGTFAF